MAGPLNGAGVRNKILQHGDKLLKQGKSASESAAYFWGNITEGVQDSTKGVITIDSGRRAVLVLSKPVKILRGVMFCVGACAVFQ